MRKNMYYNTTVDTDRERTTDTPMTLPSFPDTPVYGPTDTPMTLPSFPDTPVYGPTDTPMTLPSFPDTPVYDPSNPNNSGQGMNGNDIPMTLPSFPDTPVYDPSNPNNSGQGMNGNDIPMTLPSFPDTPVVSPIPPNYPSVPVVRYTNIRVLHALENGGAVNILLNGVALTEGLTYGNITAYSMENAGNILVTVVASDNPSKYIVQESLRFNFGDSYTLAIIPANIDGSANNATGFTAALYKIEDSSCNKTLYNSCLRAVNLAPITQSLDVSLLDGRTIAKGLAYRDIGNFRQFTPGQYRVLVYDSSCSMGTSTNNAGANARGIGISIIPIIVGNTNATCMADLLLTSQISVRSSSVYTLFIIGSPYTPEGLKLLFTESYFEG